MKLFSAILAFGLTIGAAQAATLDFSGNICNGGSACGNRNLIDQSYGDQTGVDVQYDTNSAAGLQGFSWWNNDFSDLLNVAYSSGNQASISLVAQAGYRIILNSFELGAWPNVDRDSRVHVYEFGTNVDFIADTPITVSGSTSSVFSGAFSSTLGIVIDFGPEYFNVGIDNISFTVEQVSPSVVPLPAGGLLLAGALFGLGITRRRKTS